MDEGRQGSAKQIFEKNMKICAEQYILSHKLGEGNFGEVYLAVANSEVKNPKNEQIKQMAIKIERDMASKQAQLPNEA